MAEDIPDTGAVFTFGKSHFADNEPSHFFIKNDPVVAISCGDEHSAAICQNGRVFVFGANAWGQLGLGHKDETTRPSCVKWLKPHRVMFVACGRAHTVFVTDTNSIYTVGCNDEGQLGTGDMEHHMVPQYVELEDQAPICQVSAGSNHTAILTDQGRVFVCGSNTEGQLGLGEATKSSTHFTELKFMEKIAFVECGYYHTVFITTGGVVFVTGDNENQKLAVADAPATIFVPVVLPLETPIKSACCGAAHTFLLSMDEGKILAFGSNEKGQLGLTSDVEFVTQPTEIDMEKMFDGFQLKLVACGAMHTAFVTDNGLLYTCGESRHNKLCFEGIDAAHNSNEAPNQYSPKRVTSMNGYIVDNVACGGCHTLLTATRGSNADFTNNDVSVMSADTRQIPTTELPPLKIPTMNKTEEITNEDAMNANADAANKNMNGETGSINSLEANVSGSPVANISDLVAETTDSLDVNKDGIDPTTHVNGETAKVIDSMDKMIENISATVDNAVEDLKNKANETEDKITDNIKDLKEKANETIQTQKVAVEDVMTKIEYIIPGMHCDEVKALDVPDKTAEIANSPPPKSPLIQDLLHVPDLSQMSPNLSKESDDGVKSENGQSEIETIPCDSDKSSPQGKTAKMQAVMPIVRSEDTIDSNLEDEHHETEDVVVKDKGRFARIFQSIKDKENSCMGKGKIIEENITESVHKGIDNAEESVHKIEETVETEIRNQTNSRACTIL